VHNLVIKGKASGGAKQKGQRLSAKEQFKSSAFLLNRMKCL